MSQTRRARFPAPSSSFGPGNGYGQVAPLTIWEDGPAFAAVWFCDDAWTQYEVAVWVNAPSVYVERLIPWS